MKRIFLSMASSCLILCLLCGSEVRVSAQTPSENMQGTLKDVEAKSGVKRPENIYAVIIGIDEYEDTRIPPLRFRVNDAQGLYDVLTDPHYGRVPEDHVKLLLNQEATARNIKAAIGQWLARQAGGDDAVIIYYTGHAGPEQADMYWVTHDAAIDDLYGTALSSNEIVDLIDRVESAWTLTLVDSSYSAATIRDSRPQTIQTQSPGKGRMAISATDGKQHPLDMEAYEHSVFTYYLLEGLKGKADGMAGTERDGVVDVEELWNYLRQNVTETARKQGYHQTPVFQGSLADRIPLTYDWEYLKENATQRRMELKEKQATLTKFFEEGAIRADHFECASLMLEAEQTNGYLEALLAGDLSPKTFELLFTCPK